MGQPRRGRCGFAAPRQPPQPRPDWLLGQNRIYLQLSPPGPGIIFFSFCVPSATHFLFFLLPLTSLSPSPSSFFLCSLSDLRPSPPTSDLP